jgi:uncharacterized protein (TIGR03067 family)
MNQRVKSRGEIKRLQAAGSAAAHRRVATELGGEWAMVSCALDGRHLEEPFIECASRVTEANETTVLFAGLVYTRARFTVDRSKAPKTIDCFHTHGPSKGQLQYGVWELEGKTLKLCFASPGEERPADFTTEPGDGNSVSVWTLVEN